MTINHLFTRFARWAARKAGHPLTFFSAVAIIVLWALIGPLFGFSDTWQLINNTGTTIVTFLMVFLIQNAQNRDASAIQAKLDELIRAAGKARNEFIGIEHLSAAELIGLLRTLEKVAGDEQRHHQAIERLIGSR